MAEAMADAVMALASSDDLLMELQASPFMLVNPTPPSIDIFPADPSQDWSSFGPASRQTFWTIRARVSTADDVSGQTILMMLMEPAGSTSLKAAIEGDSGVASVVDGIAINGPSGFRLYQNPAPHQDLEHQGALLGVEWQGMAYVSEEPTT